MKRVVFAVVALGVLTLIPLQADTLNISGSTVLGLTSETFNCNEPGDTVCAVPPAGKGDFAVAGSTGSFAQYNGTFGLIKDFNNALRPLNAPFSLPGFITFDLNNNVTIDLTFLPLGTDTLSIDCSGLLHCTPQSALLVTPTDPTGASGLNIDGNATGTVATFQVTGTAHVPGGSTQPVTGTFMFNFIGLTPQNVFAAVIPGNSAGYNLTLNTPLTVTPEPGEIVLTCLGLLTLAAVSQFRERRRSLKAGAGNAR